MSSTASPAAPAAVQGWSVDAFRRFWAKPDLATLRGIERLCTEDIVGHWPRRSRPTGSCPSSSADCTAPGSG
jgi:hypothetical protein